MFQKGIHIKDVNLSGIDLPTDDATKSALIYNAVKNTYGFPILLSNFKINGAKRDAILVSPIVLTDSVVINLGDYYLTISATAITATEGVNLVGAVISGDGDVEVGRNLEVDGTSTLTGDVSMGGDATITGDASIGGKTTITGDTSIGGDATIAGDLEVTGDIKGMEKIVDSDGNARFVEGSGTLNTIEGVTITYNKWSLSGTHLMLVLAGTIEEGTSITPSILVHFVVPQYILDKVYPVVNSVIDTKSISLFATDYSAQMIGINFTKTNDGFLFTTDSITLTKTRSFRIQFDLLIDAEPAD